MRSNIIWSGLSLSVRWPGGALESSGFQDFGTQHLKTETSRVPLRDLNQPVQRLRVSIGYGVVKIGENWLVPVAHGRQQGLECLFQIGRSTEKSRLNIERLGYGLSMRRRHTGMFYLFSIAEVREIKAYLDEHEFELSALYEQWRQSQRGGDRPH